MADKYSVQKKIFIGLGTGRCGTTSLAHVLNNPGGCQITHESEAIRTGMTWAFREEGAAKALQELESRGRPVSGDVAFYYLPYVEWMALKRPDATFVCLKRDRSETVESYMRKTEERDHWTILCDMADPWDRLYPKFNTRDKREALGMYWDMYYGEAKRLEDKGIRIKTFEMSCLNSEEGIREIMAFAGLTAKFVRAGVRSNPGRSV